MGFVRRLTLAILLLVSAVMICSLIMPIVYWLITGESLNDDLDDLLENFRD